MAKKGSSLASATKAIDPTLDALFSSSAGPLKVPSSDRYNAVNGKKEVEAEGSSSESDEEDNDAEEEDDEVLSEISEEFDDGGSDEEESKEEEEEEEVSDEEMGSDDDATASKIEDLTDAVPHDGTQKKRKRNNNEENDDLEDKYMKKLVDSEEPEGKRQKADASDKKTKKKNKETDGEDDEDAIPVHESLSKEKDDEASALERSTRTVFLGNVNSEAISSKSSAKILKAHLSSILDADAKPAQKIESIRFRSAAFSDMAMPKRAAYITGALLDATTKSTNAYVVYSTAAAARKAVSELNGTEVLNRHLRVDSVAHPAAMKHRACVFVGNLGFVDDETITKKNEDGEEVTKKRNKVPSDIEEGLWRQFGKCGKVENVRVVRDPKTRVGKGIAYVQFYDENAVEGALLLDGKKFPPMLPRALRVSRAKDPKKTTLAQERSKAKALAAANASKDKSMKYKPKAIPEQQSMAGRTGRLLGQSALGQQRKGGRKQSAKDAASEGDGDKPEIKGPEAFIFEGRRVSIKDRLPTDLKGKKGKSKPKPRKPAGKPQNRSTKRAANWQKSSSS